MQRPLLGSCGGALGPITKTEAWKLVAASQGPNNALDLGGAQRALLREAHTLRIAWGDAPNIARGLTPTVSSECSTANPTGKAYLTDGHYFPTSCPGDRDYWHSCAEADKWARLDFGGARRVSHVRIWARCDGHADQMAGAVAEVLNSAGRWVRCGGVAPDVGPAGAFAFRCGVVGTAARVRKTGSAGRPLAIAELEVFGDSETGGADALLDDCLVRHDWKAPAVVAALSPGAKRDAVIQELSALGKGSVAWLQGRGDEELAELCPAGRVLRKAAVADHFVRSGSHTGAVQSPVHSLYIKKGSTAEANRRVFLRWTLSPEVAAAGVQLYVGWAGTTATSAMWEFRVVYDQWDESSVTWDTQPALGPPVAVVRGQPAGTYVRFAIPGAVLDAARAAGVLSLGAQSTVAAGGAWFASREALDPDHRPQLICHTSTALPAAFSASSERDAACAASNAAIPDACDPQGPSWCPASDAPDSEWLEAEVGPARITALEVEGGGAGYVTGYKAQVFNGVWTDVHYGAALPGAFAAACAGGRWVELPAPMAGTRVRVAPVSYSGAWPALRLRVHGLALADAAASVAAVDGAVTPPMVKAVRAGQAFVWQPQGRGGNGPGQVAFAFTATAPTTVRFAIEVHAPSGNADSFWIQVDDGAAKAWHTGHCADWCWRAYGQGFDVAPGRHWLRLKAREDGTQVAAVRVEGGLAAFSVPREDDVVYQDPVQDHFVAGGPESGSVQPPGNLRVNQDPDAPRRAFVQWDLAALAREHALLGARVRLYVTGAGSRVQKADWEVLEVPGPWDAATLTWDAQPPLGPLLATVGAEKAGTLVEFDVPAAVLARARAAGALSIGIRATVADGTWAQLASMEHATADYRPKLMCRIGPLRSLHSYPNIAEVDVPRAATGPYAGPPPSTRLCDDSAAFQRVDVRCIQGDCGLPAQMYFGLQDGRVCHGHAVGLVSPPCAGQPGCACDAPTTVAGVAAAYFGDAAQNCHAVVGQGGPPGVIPQAMALWAVPEAAHAAQALCPAGLLAPPRGWCASRVPPGPAAVCVRLQYVSCSGQRGGASTVCCRAAEDDFPLAGLALPPGLEGYRLFRVDPAAPERGCLKAYGGVRWPWAWDGTIPDWADPDPDFAVSCPNADTELSYGLPNALWYQPESLTLGQTYFATLRVANEAGGRAEKTSDGVTWTETPLEGGEVDDGPVVAQVVVPPSLPPTLPPSLPPTLPPSLPPFFPPSLPPSPPGSGSGSGSGCRLFRGDAPSAPLPLCAPACDFCFASRARTRPRLPLPSSRPGPALSFPVACCLCLLWLLASLLASKYPVLSFSVLLPCLPIPLMLSSSATLLAAGSPPACTYCPPPHGVGTPCPCSSCRAPSTLCAFAVLGAP